MTNAEIVDLKSMSCNNKDIGAIDGIQQLTALTSIDLGYNRIVNISPLLQLDPAKITYLSLKGNDVALCHQLDALKSKFHGLVLPDKCLNMGALIAALSIL